MLPPHLREKQADNAYNLMAHAGKQGPPVNAFTAAANVINQVTQPGGSSSSGPGASITPGVPGGMPAKGVSPPQLVKPEVAEQMDELAAKKA